MNTPHYMKLKANLKNKNNSFHSRHAWQTPVGTTNWNAAENWKESTTLSYYSILQIRWYAHL